MNQHRHAISQTQDENRIPGRQRQSAGLWGALQNERGYQQNFAALQSLQQQLDHQRAMQARYGQMQGQGQLQGPQHQPFAQMGWGNLPSMEARRLRPRDFSGLADMFDGGGAGQSGDTFQGGGLFSVFGNLAGTKPRGQG